jgi:hypothetical protein
MGWGESVDRNLLYHGKIHKIRLFADEKWGIMGADEKAAGEGQADPVYAAVMGGMP